VKRDIRWQLLLALICLGLVLSILSFQAQSVGLCTATVPATGGVLVEGLVGQPQQLNPLLSAVNPVDQELVSLIFDGLTRYNEVGQLEPALASEWSFSEDGLTVHFVLRDDVTWHDGEPFTAADVAFTYGLLQQEAFPAPYEVKALWQSVVISTTDVLAIDFRLPQPYAPFVDTTNLGILPAHLLEDVPVERLAEHSFNQSPVGTGPFLVVPTQSGGSLRLAPNPSYWREGLMINGIEFRFFPDSQALAEAFEAGTIQAITSVLPADLPQIAALPGVRLFSAGAPRYTQLIFNLTDSASPAVRSKEVRQALAFALDRSAVVENTMSSQGIPLEGPYLPTSWAHNAGLFTAYQHEPATAANLLAGQGWGLPEGATVRQQDGQPLVLRLLLADDPDHTAMAEELARQWLNVGIETELSVAEVAELRPALAARDFDVALVTIEPPGDPDLYDFWSQEAIIRGQNYGGWNNRRASEALEVGRQLVQLDERRPYYDAFQRFFENDLPALTLFQHVYTYGLSDSVNLADIGRIHTPRDRYQTLPVWFLSYRDVPVLCPEPAAAEPG
jgi:peptide/nickel transport system substrate-binding protein